MSDLPVLVQLENALGAALLRADLLGAERPRLAGRYLVRSLLGRGARGLVVAVTDERLGRELAMKLLPRASWDESALAEARALARLEHPNVVRVYDCDVTEASIDDRAFALSYVTMQRVRGPTLRSWLSTGSRGVGEILAVFEGVGRGLAAAHDAGLVHRDVKPENVVVAEDGPKVIDFGFASPAGGGAAAGTRAYLAPETEHGVQTAASDQYAFAIALEEALGERDVPDHVAAAIARGRAHEPKKRFASMHALLRALAPRRRWPWVLASAVALGALVIGLALTDAHAPMDTTFTACARAAGAYSFTGYVDDAIPDVNHELWSAYRVKLTPRAACRFDLEITKYTDDAATGFYDWRGVAADVPAAVREDGSLALETQVTLHRPGRTEPYEHAFVFVLDEARLAGSFDVLDRRSGFARVYGGRLAGRKDRGTPLRPATPVPTAEPARN